MSQKKTKLFGKFLALFPGQSLKRGLVIWSYLLENQSRTKVLSHQFKLCWIAGIPFSKKDSEQAFFQFFFSCLQEAARSSKKLQELVQEVLQRNAYFAHPEAILLVMLVDDDADTRAQAVNQILTIRMKAQNLDDQSNEEDVDDG